MSDNNVFWSEDFKSFLREYNYFFPSAHYSIVQNLNAIFRFSIYLGLALAFYRKDPVWFLLPVVVAVITYIFYKNHPSPKEMFRISNSDFPKTVVDKERSFVKKDCVSPTVDNPFMNFNYITDNYHRKPACKAFIEETQEAVETKEKITNAFNDKLYRDVGDLYSKRNSQREFYTVPYNGIPDQTAFAKWCNLIPGGTCKEDGLRCSSTTSTLA